MKISLLRRWTSFAVCFLMITSLISPAMASEIAKSFEAEPDSKVSLNDFEIEFDQSDLNLRYGDYAEIEFSAKINEEIEFEIDESMAPVGLQIESIGSNTALLLGAPEFLEKFCFPLLAKSKSSDKEASQRVCLFAQENETLEHPKFETPRHLDSVSSGAYASFTIRLDARHSHIEPVFVLGELPEGLDVSTSRGEFTISGNTEFTGVFEFVVLAQNENFYVYKQYQLEITPEAGTVYQCDVGYYYDATVGYCVQNQGRICRDGTFYDPDLRQCVRYTSPPHITCGPGSHYDHFLHQCVANSHQRCPYNYSWDSYSNRCERLPNTCSIGYKYSWTLRSCVYVGAYQCGINQHYSSYQGRCVPNYGYCRAGSYWDGYSCRPTSRRCIGVNRYFDPILRTCRSRNYYHTCSAGSTYSYDTGRCERRRVFDRRVCRAGTRYSNRTGSCINVRPVPHRPVRVRRPAPRRPVVVRPTRPAHRPHRPNRPNRPTTRPAPTRPTRPTTRPTPTRPTRPTTRPTPTRPTGPTTRPTPTRPSRPTTRPTPTRPSGPTTRPTPTRPSRPTTRPTPTRPSRPTTRPTPTRPSGPTTRPTPTRPSRPTTRPTPTRPSGPTTRPAPSRPATRPAPSRPATRPAPSRPATRPAPSRPATRPAPSRPATRPAPSRPATRPAPSRPTPSRPSRPAPPRRRGGNE